MSSRRAVLLTAALVVGLASALITALVIARVAVSPTSVASGHGPPPPHRAFASSTGPSTVPTSSLPVAPL